MVSPWHARVLMAWSHVVLKARRSAVEGRPDGLTLRALLTASNDVETPAVEAATPKQIAWTR
jgi:hypothetical protein